MRVKLAGRRIYIEHAGHELRLTPVEAHGLIPQLTKALEEWKRVEQERLEAELRVAYFKEKT